ncbi:MAG: methyltransferase domain-containing protein [Bacteroidota bacterium]
MTNLRQRSGQKELLDDPAIPFADIRRNMQELNLVNTYLGGHRVSIKGLNKILRQSLIPPTVTICEIGCGGGDNLQAIAKWCSAKGIKARFIGIDIKQECIEYAMQQYPDLDAEWIVSDYKKVFFAQQPYIIFSSLFCHHFSNEELVFMLGWMQQYAQLGFFINDLHRHVLAYQSIRTITQLVSRSYLVKNDAPLSVARGFTKTEWQQLLAAAEIERYTISWEWAFRHLIVYCHD